MKPHAVRFHSGDRKSKRVIERERPFVKIFLFASVLFKYLIVKLKIFLGIFCCMLGQRELVLGNDNFDIDENAIPVRFIHA